GIPGLRRVQPLVLGRVLLPALASRSALLLGVEFDSDETTRNFWGLEVRVTNPLAFLPGQRPVFVGKELAQNLGPGSRTLVVRAGGQEQSLTTAGTMDAHGVAATL